MDRGVGRGCSEGRALSSGKIWWKQGRGQGGRRTALLSRAPDHTIELTTLKIATIGKMPRWNENHTTKQSAQSQHRVDNA